MKIYFSIVLISLSFFGCKKDTAGMGSDFAYIGGEIINPIENTIILTSQDKTTDTIKLDGRNRFIYKIEDLKPGLYTFKHGSEFQLILLEPNDSLLFRLNTFDFDESLVYTGRGAKQNNFLLNEFLENEKTEKSIHKSRSLSPKDFSRKTDSVRQAQINKFKAFKNKHEVSKTFENLVLEHINYSYYASKETYPFRRTRQQVLEAFNSLPNDFYAYRKNVDYNDADLKNFFAYKWFLKSNISNIALKKHMSHCANEDFKRGRSLCFNLDRLKFIDSLVSDSDLKEELLYHYTVKFLSTSENNEGINVVLQNYLDKTENEKGKKMIMKFADAIEKLAPGNRLPNLEIVDYQNNTKQINKVLKGTTVITFWSNMYYDHFMENHRKIRNLKKKYPEVTFISINIDNHNPNKAMHTLRSNFGFNNEYFLKTPIESTEKLAIHPMTKTFILDKNKTIVNSNTNIFYGSFEGQLLGLLNN